MNSENPTYLYKNFFNIDSAETYSRMVMGTQELLSLMLLIILTLFCQFLYVMTKLRIAGPVIVETAQNLKY